MEQSTILARGGEEEEEDAALTRMRDAAAMGQRQGGDEGDGDGDGDGDPPTSSSLRRVVMVDSNLLCTRLNHESERNAHILNKNGVTTIIFPSAILWTYTNGTNILKKA